MNDTLIETFLGKWQERYLQQLVLNRSDWYFPLKYVNISRMNKEILRALVSEIDPF